MNQVYCGPRCIHLYSNCISYLILMAGNTKAKVVVKRSDCILVYTKGDVVKRSDCILVYRSTTKGDGCCEEV